MSPQRRGIPKPKTDAKRKCAAPATEPRAQSIADWFAQRGWTPFPFQREVWQAYAAGESGLIHAATGTGKTYAAWLGPIQEWLDTHPDHATWKKLPAQPLHVLWITPLRALAADTLEALQLPLAALGLPWTLETRTGDTSSSVRNRQRKRLPTALVTTPESLSLLLARDDAFELFANLRMVVVDEWHELLASKRGVQTELGLARLRYWRPGLRVWGLSATLGNLDVALQVLNGSSGKTVRMVQGLLPKTTQIDSLIPESMERFPWAGHLGLRLLPQVIESIEEGATTLVFTNTRAQTEIWYQQILQACPDFAGLMALHHGSLDPKVRDWVEEGLRTGSLRCVVCTSSLDLGVDFSPVDRVLQIGSPKGVGRLLQRAGRSGHRPGVESRITFVPTHALELVEVSAAREAALAGKIEGRQPMEKPLDVLVQHLVTVALGGGFEPEQLYQEVRSAHAYRDLTPLEWGWVLDFVTKGGRSLYAYPEYRRVVEVEGRHTVTDQRIARRHRMAIGTITSDPAIQVRYLRGAKLGTVEETFISRMRPGDHFVFAGKLLELARVQDLTAYVRKAKGKPGTVPRWVGGRLPLSSELSAAIRGRLDEARQGIFADAEMQAVRPILELQADWSLIPSQSELLIERLKTRDGHHLFIYPFAGRLVHEGLAALWAYRLARRQPITFTLTFNDYGLELLAPEPAPLEKALDEGLLSPDNLLDDIPASLNATELARRQFREIARISGLIFPGTRDSGNSMKYLQASSSLFYNVFANHEPDNLLLDQAHREVLERQLEYSRLYQALQQLAASTIRIVELRRPTPFGFPLMVDRLRERVSSETLADRVRKMQLDLEKAAG